MSDLFALALVNGIIWAGLFGYFIHLDMRIRKLEKR
jgi:CcmD family protein